MAELTLEERIRREQAVTFAGFDISTVQEWFTRYCNHRNAAKQRGLESHLTFEDYVKKAGEGGITNPYQLGSFSGQYHLGRVGDIGNYDVNNCRFITSNQNHREAHENGRNVALYEKMRGETKETSERARKISEAHLGRTKESHQYLEERSIQQSGRTKETHAYLAEKGPKISESKAKAFVVTASDGTVYEGKNISTFCKTHGLSVSGLAGVCKGRLNQHKGWTGHYIVVDD